MIEKNHTQLLLNVEMYRVDSVKVFQGLLSSALLHLTVNKSTKIKTKKSFAIGRQGPVIFSCKFGVTVMEKNLNEDGELIRNWQYCSNNFLSIYCIWARNG